jgi:hypothetical protein
MAQNKKLGRRSTLDIKIPLPVPISELENVECEIYSDPNKRFKFSYLEKDGYLKLNEGANSSELIGKLLSTDAAKMRGCLFMELTLIKDAEPLTENVGSAPTAAVPLTLL